MLGSKLLKIILCASSFQFVSAHVYAADPVDATTKDPVDETVDKSDKNALKKESEETPNKPADSATKDPVDSAVEKGNAEAKEQKVNRIEKELHKVFKMDRFESQVAITSGFGFIRAYKNFGKYSLGSNGLADVKISDRIGNLWGDQLFLTFHYIPFDIGPSSMTGTIQQDYIGSVNIYAAGSELRLLSHSNFDVYVSAELGLSNTHMKELVPVTESSPPLKQVGGLVIVGSEFRYKPFERFHIGPRVYFATGSVTFASFLMGGFFYF